MPAHEAAAAARVSGHLPMASGRGHSSNVCWGVLEPGKLGTRERMQPACSPAAAGAVAAPPGAEASAVARCQDGRLLHIRGGRAAATMAGPPGAGLPIALAADARVLLVGTPGGAVAAYDWPPPVPAAALTEQGKPGPQLCQLVRMHACRQAAARVQRIV